MKITSKHYKAGTRVICPKGCGSAIAPGATGVIKNADDDGFPRVVWDTPQDSDYATVQLLKRIKPEPPANPVPEGCPVDQQCHDEMTAAEWEWLGDYMDRGIYFTEGANLFVTGEFDALLGMDHKKAQQVKAGCNIIAAWRERSGK